LLYHQPSLKDLINQRPPNHHQLNRLGGTSFHSVPFREEKEVLRRSQQLCTLSGVPRRKYPYDFSSGLTSEPLPEVIAKQNFLLACISAIISHESYSSKPGNGFSYVSVEI
jgi:hypothetical protein